MSDLREVVTREYAEIARGGGGCCGTSAGDGARSSGCCGPGESSGVYPEGVRSVIPRGADLGLGCANPHSLEEVAEGETVLDLGCGAGVDVFIAASRVGKKGRVIGVDMTPEMVHRARATAEQEGIRNVEFRLGEIEHLPVADSSVDLVISNCVINLSPEKEVVWQEAYRVLRPGGRIAVADMVATDLLDAEVRSDRELHVGCVAGASTPEVIRRDLETSGFVDVEIRWLAKTPPGAGVRPVVAPAAIRGRRRRHES